MFRVKNEIFLLDGWSKIFQFEKCPQICCHFWKLGYNKAWRLGKKLFTILDGDLNLSKFKVKILHKNEPDYQDVLNSQVEKGLCPGIVKSLHIEVLHSDVGSFSNPQTKIVGVLYNFGKLSDERFTCIGLACNYG